MREPIYQRLYMFFVGSVLLLALYFDLAGLIYTLAALMIFEAVTNLRIVKLLIHLSGSPVVEACEAISPTTTRTSRFNFDAERAWQLSMGPILIVSYTLGNTLWFIPWFIALAVAGAGLSGVCPWLVALRAIGFR
jgi:disulfide bond formation protein DsbB